ncbi:uncharacterized protein SCHCODRAFT_02491890 [Schizophyllum commune H4-8]|nr:uncharacterized protein SCHCODRAFT_02491890 [Schizophyllum commune H4-8]KAI5896186.1 hypothetical protein SCHCODRAFT_02491890 [Schizophyllum commune H4-8]
MHAVPAPYNLAPETWIAIFENADRGTACALASASNALRQVGFNVLFDRIVIRREEQRCIRALRSILPAARSIELYGLDHCLRAILFVSTLPRCTFLLFSDEQDWDQDTRVFLALKSWLHAAPSLQYLTLDFDTSEDLTSALLLVPRLRKLAIIAYRALNVYTTITTHVWPDLEELHLREGTGLAMLDDLPPGNHFPALKTLRLLDLFLLRPVPSLDRFLAESCHTLSRLHLDLNAAFKFVGRPPFPAESMTTMMPLLCNTSLPCLTELRVVLDSWKGADSRAAQLLTVERLLHGLVRQTNAPIRKLTLEVKVLVMIRERISLTTGRKDNRWQDVCGLISTLDRDFWTRFVEETLPVHCTVEILLPVRTLLRPWTYVTGPARDWRASVRDHVSSQLQEYTVLKPMVTFSPGDCVSRRNQWHTHPEALDLYPSLHECTMEVAEETEDDDLDDFYEIICIEDYQPSLHYRDVAIG